MNGSLHINFYYRLLRRNVISRCSIEFARFARASFSDQRRPARKALHGKLAKAGCGVIQHSAFCGSDPILSVLQT